MPAVAPRLPIHGIADQLVAAWRTRRRVVLTAPTGSGKSTQVPQILHAAAPPDHGRILVLQPRRLAARLLAARVAQETGSPLGEDVGYQTRFDSRVSPASRIVFLTEGLLLRHLLSQPRMTGVGTVILDEFHERSLAADTALALLLRLQAAHRPDLKLVVMSATLDVERLTAHLDGPCLEAHGRAFPVDITYLARRRDAPPWELAAESLRNVLAAGGDDPAAGDVLIFMPGLYEIRRTMELCRQVAGGGAAVFALHSEMPAGEQDAALRPCAQRKIIVATNVAETSITLPGDPGVRHVIDAGLARVARFDPRRGINVLLVEPVSQASADQRAGRAGRTAPGTAHRLWTQAQQRARPAQTTPEIQRLDLAQVMLQLTAMGVEDLGALPWLEPPAPPAIAQARRLLGQLEALDEQGALTPLGRRMVAWPMHPRLGRMLAEAQARGCTDRAALWAALVGERDILLRTAGGRWKDAGAGPPACDLAALEAAFHAARQSRFDAAACTSLGVHAQAARQVEQAVRSFAVGAADPSAPPPCPGAVADLLKCVLAGFPDHVAVYKGPAHRACALSAGRRGVLDKASAIEQAGLIVAVEIAEVGGGAQVRTVLSLAGAIEPAWLEQVHPHRLRDQRAIVWNAPHQRVESVQRLTFDDLVLEERPSGVPDPDQAAHMLAQRIAAGEVRLAHFDDKARQWIARVRCVSQWCPERRLIAYDDDDLALIYEELCRGAVRAGQVVERPVLAPLRAALSWADQQFVEAMAPAELPLPSSRRLRIEYQPGNPPKGRARIQELYDLKHNPRVAGGRVAVALEILGPNHRPVQVTADLPRFWRELYPVLKKELARKYPRHEWR